ncbi:MAG: PaaI family thioesterase [Acidobacteriota bacterium]
MDAVNQGIDEHLFAYIIETNKKAPFYETLEVKTKELGPGHAEMAVVAAKKHSNPLGMVHGGLIATLADAAMGNAIRTTGRKAVTVDYTISLLASASIDEYVKAIGQVTKVGKQLIFARAEVYAGDKMIATSQGTFYVVGDIHIG